MSLSRAGTVSWICFMFGSNERPYPGRVLISLWCDFDNKNYDFFAFKNFSGYFRFAYFGYYQNFVIYLLGILTGPEKFVWRIVFLFI